MEKGALHMSSKEKHSLTEGTLGQILARARKDRGLSVVDVCDQLRLSSARIHAIEKDQYLQEEVNVFTRGHVKSYAKFLGLGDDVVRNAFVGLGIQYEQPRTIALDDSGATTEKKLKIKQKLVFNKTFIYSSFALLVILLWWCIHYSNLDSAATNAMLHKKSIGLASAILTDKSVDAALNEKITENDSTVDVAQPLIGPENVSM